MSNSNALLLPLYHVRKQTKYFSFNEKNLIGLLLISSILSLYVLLKNLPSNTLNNAENVRFFIPKISRSPGIFHNEQGHDHHDLILPPPPDLEKLDAHKNQNNAIKNDKNAIRQEKVKNVLIFLKDVLIL